MLEQWRRVAPRAPTAGGAWIHAQLRIKAAKPTHHRRWWPVGSHAAADEGSKTGGWKIKREGLCVVGWKKGKKMGERCGGWMGKMKMAVSGEDEDDREGSGQGRRKIKNQ